MNQRHCLTPAPPPTGGTSSFGGRPVAALNAQKGHLEPLLRRLFRAHAPQRTRLALVALERRGDRPLRLRSRSWMGAPRYSSGSRATDIWHVPDGCQGPARLGCAQGPLASQLPATCKGTMRIAACGDNGGVDSLTLDYWNARSTPSDASAKRCIAPPSPRPRANDSPPAQRTPRSRLSTAAAAVARRSDHTGFDVEHEHASRREDRLREPLLPRLRRAGALTARLDSPGGGKRGAGASPVQLPRR